MNPIIRHMTQGALCAVLMLGVFAVLMIPGFWLRHGYPIWEAF